MTAHKIYGTILLLVGVIFLAGGIWQLREVRTPSVCVANFAKALGGKSSMEFEDSLREKKCLAIAGISIGVILTFGGGLLLLKANKRSC